MSSASLCNELFYCLMLACIHYRPALNKLYTDKKENKIFLIYQEIQRDVIFDERPPHIRMMKYLRISSYIRKPFFIYDFAPEPF